MAASFLHLSPPPPTPKHQQSSVLVAQVLAGTAGSLFAQMQVLPSKAHLSLDTPSLPDLAPVHPLLPDLNPKGPGA
jgi:hypothetical protein